MLTDRMRTEIPSGAQLPAAPLPGRQSLGQAGQVILSLLLTGLAAAAVWLLAVVVAASAGGLGPHPPGHLPHARAVANPRRAREGGCRGRVAVGRRPPLSSSA